MSPNSEPLLLTLTVEELVTRNARLFGYPFRFWFPPRFSVPVTQMRTRPAGEILIAPGKLTLMFDAT
jgi:hypothetical protein